MRTNPYPVTGGRTPVRFRSHPRLAIVLAALGLTAGGLAIAPAAAADYTQGVTALNATQARIRLSPTTTSALVDVHYRVAGLPQQSFRMAHSAGTWEQTVSGLSAGTVLTYWFTYEKGGPLFDTPQFTYTHQGSGGGGGGAGTFPMKLVNNTNGAWADSQVFVTILGQAVPGEWSHLKPNGTWTHINFADTNAPGHLTKNGRNFPNMSFTLAQAGTVHIPTRTEGGRVYLSLGSPVFISVSPDNRGWGGPDLNNPTDPNQDVYFDWYEYTYVFGQVPFGGNTTQVDQFAIPITARLQQAASGYDRTAGITQARAQILSGYQASVGSAFRGLAGKYRILAPRTSAAFKPSGGQAKYLQAYIDQVWSHYTTHQWTENDHGVVLTGRVSGGILHGVRTNDGAPFSLRKPTTTEVFECSGVLALGDERGGNDLIRAVGRDFCAAFHRGVALNTAAWFDPRTYYQTNPKDDYAAYFHRISLNKRSYAFAYDDVNDQSSVQILNNSNPPDLLTLRIGW